MSKLAVICAPDKAALGTITEKLASGAAAVGATVDVFDASMDPAVLAAYDAAAFGLGCGGEEILLSLFSRSLTKLKGKKTAIFGCLEGKDEFGESLVRIGKAAHCVMVPSARAEELGAALVHKKEIRPDLAGTVPVIFSTITGNGYKLAVAAAEALPDYVGPYNIRYITDEVIDKFDTFVLSYWCNHGTADDDTIDLISRMHGKKLIVIGSLGVATDTAHAARSQRTLSLSLPSIIHCSVTTSAAEALISAAHLRGRANPRDRRGISRWNASKSKSSLSVIPMRKSLTVRVRRSRSS